MQGINAIYISQIVEYFSFIHSNLQENIEKLIFCNRNTNQKHKNSFSSNKKTAVLCFTFSLCQLLLRFFNHCVILFLSLSELWIPPISLFHLIFHLLFWVKQPVSSFIFFNPYLFLLEHRHNLDPNNKLVYAVADGQYTFGPLSLYQYHNDERFSKTFVNLFEQMK